LLHLLIRLRDVEALLLHPELLLREFLLLRHVQRLHDSLAGT
jgi:hypothetical protein